MSGKLPTGLRMYRLLSAAVGPFTPIFLARRLKRGKDCRRCRATGKRIRVGRWLYNRWARIYRAGTDTRPEATR